jgi:ADP-Ribosyltransferase in polyvalent proteins
MNYQKIHVDHLPPGGWGVGSRVVDAEGHLLPVYRGQHGGADHWEESFLGSLSFGSLAAAESYALNPNRRDMVAQAPKIFPVYLDLRNPFVVSKTDSFLDLSRYAEVFGLEETKRVARKYRDYVCSTDAWADTAKSVGGFEKMVEAHPDAMLELYFLVYALLDDAEEVALLRERGFDGAIHGGSGATAMQTEYRVFSSGQVKSVWDSSLTRA